MTPCASQRCSEMYKFWLLMIQNFKVNVKKHKKYLLIAESNARVEVFYNARLTLMQVAISKQANLNKDFQNCFIF